MKSILFGLVLAIVCYCQTQLYHPKKNDMTLLKWGSQVYHFQFDYPGNFDLDFHQRGISEIFFKTEPELDKKTFQMFKLYLKSINVNTKIVQSPQANWTIVKYQNEQIQSHCDKVQKKNKKLLHVATQLVYPPRTICNYTHGQLVIYEGEQYTEIVPDQNLWTYVILPIGVRHQIKFIQGKRLNFGRPFFIQYKDFGNFSPRTCNNMPNDPTRRLRKDQMGQL